MLIRRYLLLSLVILGFSGSAQAIDPRDPNYKFTFNVFPPGGFSPKKAVVVPRPDPKQPKANPLVGKDGKFPEWGQWYYKICTDPKAFEEWWIGYFSDDEIWKYTESPVFKGYQPGNQGHRLISFLGVMYAKVKADPEIDQDVKDAMCTDEWKRAVENVIREKTIDKYGVLSYRVSPEVLHQGNLAQTFHFMRTKYGAMKLNVANIYTLDKAQDLIAAMLTEPWMICEEDKWLPPPNDTYLETLGAQKGGSGADVRLVKDGKIFFAGGMFLGWTDKPALHGTWDGLAIINQLFKYHPEPDPANSKSIFYKWNKLSDAKKEIGKKMIKLCADKLWLDKDKGQPIWTWVRNGKWTDDDARPSESKWMPAYDGYGDNQLGWASQCCEEIFGDPSRNTNDGAQSLLAIAHGTVLKKLTMPVGQQVPGRYDYERELQLKGIDADRKLLEDEKTQKMIKEKYGLTVEEAKKRIDSYYVSAGLPPGQTPHDDSPKLDPTKAGKAKVTE